MYMYVWAPQQHNQPMESVLLCNVTTIVTKTQDFCRRQKPYSINTFGLKPQRLHSCTVCAWPRSLSCKLLRPWFNVVGSSAGTHCQHHQRVLTDLIQKKSGVKRLKVSMLSLGSCFGCMMSISFPLTMSLSSLEGIIVSLLCNARQQETNSLETTVKPTTTTVSGPQSSCAYAMNLQKRALLSSVVRPSTFKWLPLSVPKLFWSLTQVLQTRVIFFASYNLPILARIQLLPRKGKLLIVEQLFGVCGSFVYVVQC